MKSNPLIISLCVSLLWGCNETPRSAPLLLQHTDNNKASSIILNKKEEANRQLIFQAEQKFLDAGMVNVLDTVPDLLIDLRYSGVNNIAGTDMYGPVINAYLQPDVAQKLKRAQQLLKDTLPDHTLLIYDAARPLSVQQIIWDSTKMPLHQKVKYLSNPKRHSIHNYGAAVDLTIAGIDSTSLDMGTPYDHFGPEAHPVREYEMLSKGLLTREQLGNRKLLRKIMNEAGFRTFPYEWWHFNACSRETARKIYTLVE